MAGINFLNKIKEGSGELLGKVKLSVGDTGENSSGRYSLKMIKNEKAEILQEKQKYLGFLGMATFELYKAKEIAHIELEVDCKRLTELDEKLENLDKELEIIEKMNQSKNICECGCKINGREQFCPNCGKKIPRDTVTCICGNVLKKDQRFCPRCGKSIEELIAAEESGTKEAMQWRECICGAKISSEQFMCMECGRPVE